MTAESTTRTEDLELLSDRWRGLDEVTLRAVQISESRVGMNHTGRQNRALSVLVKLIAHNGTLLNISEGSWLDHFSVAAVGRSSLDTALVAMYLSEPSLSQNQWDLRRHVLFLHDLVNRKRFLTAMGGEEFTTKDLEFFENYEEVKFDLRKKIKAFSTSEKYSRDRIERFQSGQLVFLDGARGAVREAGWNIHHFEFLQSYWSAFLHAHPVSYLRFQEHEISLAVPSSFQLGFVAVVLEEIARFTESVVERMEKFTGSVEADPLPHVD